MTQLLLLAVMFGGAGCANKENTFDPEKIVGTWKLNSGEKNIYFQFTSSGAYLEMQTFTKKVTQEAFVHNAKGKFRLSDVADLSLDQVYDSCYLNKRQGFTMKVNNLSDTQLNVEFINGVKLSYLKMSEAEADALHQNYNPSVAANSVKESCFTSSAYKSDAPVIEKVGSLKEQSESSGSGNSDRDAENQD